MGYIDVFIGITVTILVSWLEMSRSEAIDNYLGEGGAIMTRLIGLILIAIAMEFIVNGIMDIAPEPIRMVDEARQALMALWY